MTYKGGIFGTQEEHQAFWAFCAWHGHFEESHQGEGGELTQQYLDIWSSMPEAKRTQWRSVAKVIRWDTRTEPEF